MDVLVRLLALTGPCARIARRPRAVPDGADRRACNGHGTLGSPPICARPTSCVRPGTTVCRAGLSARPSGCPSWGTALWTRAASDVLPPGCVFGSPNESASVLSMPDALAQPWRDAACVGAAGLSRASRDRQRDNGLGRPRVPRAGDGNRDGRPTRDPLRRRHATRHRHRSDLRQPRPRAGDRAARRRPRRVDTRLGSARADAGGESHRSGDVRVVRHRGADPGARRPAPDHGRPVEVGGRRPKPRRSRRAVACASTPPTLRLCGRAVVVHVVARRRAVSSRATTSSPRTPDPFLLSASSSRPAARRREVPVRQSPAARASPRPRRVRRLSRVPRRTRLCVLARWDRRRSDGHVRDRTLGADSPTAKM